MNRNFEKNYSLKLILNKKFYILMYKTLFKLLWFRRCGASKINIIDFNPDVGTVFKLKNKNYAYRLFFAEIQIK